MMNLGKKLNDLDYQSRNKTKRKKPLFRLAIIILILLVVIGLPVKGTIDGFKGVQSSSKALASAYTNQNFGQLQKEINNTKNSLKAADTSLGFLFWLRIIPVVGGYYGDIKGLTSAGVEELSAVDYIFTELKPQEKELGFLGTPLPGQDRIAQGLKILDKAMPLMPKVENNFKKAYESVKDIDEDKYPEEFRGVRLRDTISTAKNFIIGAYIATTKHKEALGVLPAALGADSPKNYMLLFQNDKEIRPTGGFLTAFAFLKIDKGQISTTASDDIYRLDERLLGTCVSKICPLTPPAPIIKYLPEVSGKARSAWSMRDSNISPDLPTSAREFERMYQLLGQGLPFDGIIYIDTQVVEEIIEITGPIDVLGTTYSSEIDKRCNCPNVVYELESYAEIAAKGEQDRKAILGVLMQQILAKSLGADTEKLPLLVNNIVKLANHKHIMFYMHDDKTTQALKALNWTGEIKPFDGDYIHINDSNFAGGKSNLYVTQTVTQEISKDKDGFKKKLTIEYKNPQKFDIWLNGINRDYVRIYVPKGSKLISSKGSDDPVNTLEELDKTVFDAFITVRPQNSRKLEFEFFVPYQPKDKYKMLIQKQPGAKDHHYIIKMNGVTKEDFELESDQEIEF